MKMIPYLIGTLLISVSILKPSFGAISTLKADQVFVAESKKSKAYVRNGVIVGGDWAIDDVTVSAIRRAPNAGYERVVVDLAGNRAGEPAAIDRPPYYHISVSPNLKRVIVTIMGHPKLSFDANAILKSFKKSKVVSDVQLLPLLQKDRWSFVLNLKQPSGVEVFELVQPTRIILDLQAKVEKTN